MGRACDCCGEDGEYGCGSYHDTIRCQNCTEPDFTGDHVSVIYMWWQDESETQGITLGGRRNECDYDYQNNVIFDPLRDNYSDLCPFIDSPFNIRLGVSPLNNAAGTDSIWSNERTSQSLLRHTKIGETAPFIDTTSCDSPTNPVCKCILPELTICGYEIKYGTSYLDCKSLGGQFILDEDCVGSEEFDVGVCCQDDGACSYATYSRKLDPTLPENGVVCNGNFYGGLNYNYCGCGGPYFIAGVYYYLRSLYCKQTGYNIYLGGTFFYSGGFSLELVDSNLAPAIPIPVHTYTNNFNISLDTLYPDPRTTPTPPDGFAFGAIYVFFDASNSLIKLIPTSSSFGEVILPAGDATDGTEITFTSTRGFVTYKIRGNIAENTGCSEEEAIENKNRYLQLLCDANPNRYSPTFDPSIDPIETKGSPPMKLSITIVASSEKALNAFKDVVNNNEWYSYGSLDSRCEEFCQDIYRGDVLTFIDKKKELREAIQNEENLIVYDREIFMESLRKCCDVLNNINSYEAINFRYSSDLANVFDNGLPKEVTERPYYVSLFLEKNENFNGRVAMRHYLLDYNEKTEEYSGGYFMIPTRSPQSTLPIRDPAWSIVKRLFDGRNYFGVSPDFFYGYSLPLPSEEYITRQATFEKSHWKSNIVNPYVDLCCQQSWQKTQSITLTFPQVDTSITSFIGNVWGFSPDRADPARGILSDFLIWASLPPEIRTDPNFGGWKPIDHWFNTQSVETLNIINKPIKLTQIKNDESQIIFSDYKTTHYTKQESDYFDPIWVRTKNGFFDPFNPDQLEPIINNELWFNDTDKRNKVFNAISESNGDFGDFLWKLMVSPDDNGLEVNIYDAFKDITFEYQPNWITDDEIADGLADPIFYHKANGYYSYFYEKAGTVPISNKLYISKLPVARSSLRQFLSGGSSPWYFWLLISPATSKQYLPKSDSGQLGGLNRQAHDHMAIPKSHKQRFRSLDAGVPVWTGLPLTDPRKPTPLFWEDPTGGQEMYSGFEYPMCITYGFSECNLNTESFFTEIFEIVNRFGGTTTKTERGFTTSTSRKTVATTPYIYAIDSVDGSRSLDKKEIYKRDMQLEFSALGPKPRVPYVSDFASWLTGYPERWQQMQFFDFGFPFFNEIVYDLGTFIMPSFTGGIINFGPAISSYENVTVEVKISDE